MIDAPPVLSKALEDLLQGIAVELQLSTALHDQVEAHYRSLSNYLGEGLLSQYSPNIYSQGSYRIQTTVKPLSREEFDLDFIVELALPESCDPAAVYLAVAKELEQHPDYKDVERRPRCLRINFPGKYHFDVVPAIPDPASKGAGVLIPDTAQSTLQWHPTDPKGYAFWFLSRCRVELAKRAADIEPLPSQPPASRKAALQIAVQLTKRHHHLHVLDEDLRTPSIVLTTMAGQAEPQAETIGGCMSAVVAHISRSAREPQHLTHPTAPDEVISEKWNDSAVLQAFQSQAHTLATHWQQLLALQGAGYEAISNLLRDMFGGDDEGGEGPVTKALASHARGRRQLSDERRLATIAGGALGTTAPKQGNPRKTFYGDG